MRTNAILWSLGIRVMIFRFQNVLVRVFKIYRFQNLPAKIVPLSCERETIRRIFHHFENLSASCKLLKDTNATVYCVDLSWLRLGS